MCATRWIEPTPIRCYRDQDRKSTRLNSSHHRISYAVFCLKKKTSVPDQKCSWEFEREILPHLDAAYNLARWLTRNEHDAQDVVQEAYVRAFQFFAAYRGGGRAWVLRIVRNTCYNWLQENRPLQSATEFDENRFGAEPRPLHPEEGLLPK